MTSPLGATPKAINTVHASLMPWYRAVIYVGLFLAGIALWIIGTQGPDSLRWAMNIAWMPFVLALALILRWQRQAQRQVDAG